MDVKILVATHKPYWMPSDSVYMPIHVGREGKTDIGFTGDNTGDNISTKNPYFCELTGLYWAWKNLNCEYIGLCHYRRYFSTGKGLKKERIMSRFDYERLLSVYDVIVPAKRNYYIETVRSQYEHAHNKRDLDEVQQIVHEKYPMYDRAFETVMKRRRLHILNMFAMKKELFNQYCEWLFDILFTLEKRIDISDYTPYEARVFGFLSERLFNVWLEYHSTLAVKEVPVVFLEKRNWGKKIASFLLRKVKG
ncbi:DUF4422 domain-containing protein [Veillonella magna]|uniref:DUF4422 domain-containing protein n=1 Tax=Veillonella magna TaxID=464322 RepID=UPI0023F30F28|nr:DUF4422 domain-containing protein [Veillonella magna]MBD8975118.1 DUF4422 domain-containing protein [Veillonella magna]